MEWKEIPYTKICIKKMCDIINIKFKDVNFDKSDWYCSYTWTEEQSKEFDKWLVDYLYENKEVRIEIMKYGNKYGNKKDLEKVVEEFNFMYGWKHA